MLLFFFFQLITPPDPDHVALVALSLYMHSVQRPRVGREQNLGNNWQPGSNALAHYRKVLYDHSDVPLGIDCP